MDVLRLDVLTWAAGMKENPHTEQAAGLRETAGTVPTDTERYHSSRETLQG